MATEISHLHPVNGEELTIDNLTEEEYREWVEQTFHHLFEPFESTGGIPSDTLLSRFQFSGFGLPLDRRNDLILHLDANRNRRITFKEFKSIVVRLRFQDLTPCRRFGLLALLSANPGLRLQAAREKAIKHLQVIDARGRQEVTVSAPIAQECLPDAVTGYAGGGGHFRMERDGVWPTARRHVSREATVQEEEYIPETYLYAFSCVPPPFFTPLVVLIQVAVFVYYALELNARVDAEPTNALTWTTGFPYFSPLYFDPRRREDVWRFLTYMLIHQGIWPVAFNCAVTLVLGCLVEWVHKVWRVAPVYLAGIIAGSLVSSICDPFTVLAGSSGGTYALIGAHSVLIILNWEELKHDFYACRSLPGILCSGVTRVCLMVLLCGADLGIALYQRFGIPEANLSLGFSAHLAGFVTGLVLGIPFLHDVQKHPLECVVFWASLGISLAFVIFAIFWNIFWPGFPSAPALLEAIP